MTDKLIVGIDIGKRTHVATIIDETGTMVARPFSFANTTDGGETLLTRIAAVNTSDSAVVFGLEATGHYWLALYSFLSAKGYPVSVINPYQSDAFRKVHLSTTKTDKEDSFLIADLMRFGSFQETKMASETMVSLRNLSRFRVTMSQQITDTKRRIVTIMDQIFPEFETLFTDSFGKTAKALLEDYPTPESFESITTRKLTNLVTKLSKGHFKKEKADEIKQKTETSFGIAFALDSFKLELSLLLKQLDFLVVQITVVEDEIGQVMETIPTTLKTLPGVDTILAAAIISEIGDITRFKTSAQLVSFAGINPTVHQSGQFTGNKNHMSKKGSPYLRLALWKASVTSVRFNPTLKTYYEQKIKDGKTHMTVIGAVSRKLTGIIFAMMRDNKDFDEKAKPLV
ncbi:IS110 family transposase [Candidatus Gottesmanbacteria bacterium]|nr:IS110 family transposase [Candidatus Gottesmanbacteria bacterium]